MRMIIANVEYENDYIYVTGNTSMVVLRGIGATKKSLF